jgi:predicted  nucleic acid-binding Zn-ribbon protein
MEKSTMDSMQKSFDDYKK